ncbi:MAG: hypothetical protein Q8S44_07445 [Flavobacteriaceae bacterium]|nr:hypothetical protein [Flavobacteriaceae bacterium]
MKKYLFLVAFFLIVSVKAQEDRSLPLFQSFVKTSYGFMNSSKPTHFIDTEFSLYINSFGNTVDCGDDQSFFGCLLMNAFISFSAFELSGGFDTALYNGNFYIVPKAGLYLRPLYFGKVGITVSKFNVGSSIGFSIPTKKDYLIEMLYQRNFNNYKDAPFEEGKSRFQIGIQIPLFKKVKVSKLVNEYDF